MIIEARPCIVDCLVRSEEFGPAIFSVRACCAMLCKDNQGLNASGWYGRSSKTLSVRQTRIHEVPQTEDNTGVDPASTAIPESMVYWGEISMICEKPLTISFFGLAPI